MSCSYEEPYDPNPHDEQPEDPAACLNPLCRTSGYVRFQCSRCGADRCGGCVSEEAAELDACEKCASSVVYDLKAQVRKQRGELQQASQQPISERIAQVGNLVSLTPAEWARIAVSLKNAPHRAA